MSTKPAESPEATANARSRYSRAIDEAFEDASKMSGSSLTPAEFYQQFLNRTLSAIDAPAGAVWLRTPQGFLQIACQVNLDKVGLDSKRGGRQCHNEILRQVFQANPPRPVMIEPQGRLTGMTSEPGAVPAANLTDHWTLFAPIVTPEKQSLGLLEVFQDATHDARLYPTFLNYTFQMAGYASQYHTFTNARQASGLEKVYSQIENFARVIHTSLNPTEVAYHVANEGKRLVECDRLCVGVRHGRKVTVEAVSGADVVEKASTQVRRMRALLNAVLKLNEKLVYKGEKDEGLPPDLAYALDEYLAETQPKFLVVLPIRDEREKDPKKPARSVLLLECYNPPEQTEPMVQRLEVVGKHAAGALYNAAELKRIPFGFLWRPLGKIQEGLGGKNRMYAMGAAVLVALLAVCLVLIPYPLKMEAKGEFLPEYVKNVYSPTDAEVRKILVQSGDRVVAGQPVIELFSTTLQEKYTTAEAEMLKSNYLVSDYDTLIAAPNLPRERTDELRQLRAKELATVNSRRELLSQMRSMYNLVDGRGKAGFLTANADRFDANVRGGTDGRPAWMVLSATNNSELTHKTVRPNEPLMRLGYIEGPWRVELKIPQRNIGHTLNALSTPGMYKTDPNKIENGKPAPYLDVDVLLTSAPDTSYPGRLYASDIAAEAIPNRDDHNQSDPIVLAYVRVNLPEFPASRHIPRQLFVANQEVHTRIRCGDHALGYSMFHGVWEWFYEKVVFFF